MELTVVKMLQLQDRNNELYAMVRNLEQVVSAQRATIGTLEADKNYLIDNYNAELQRLLRLLQKANREIDKLKQAPLKFDKEPYRVDSKG